MLIASGHTTQLNMFQFCFIFAILSVTFADVPACPNGVVEFNVPADPDQFTWYPNNFTGSQPPVFPHNYNCDYKINVPQGWSCHIELTVNTTSPGSDSIVRVLVVDQNQISEGVSTADSESFFFIESGGKISLSTYRSDVLFGFSVKWRKNYRFDPYHSNVTVSETQPVVYWAYSTSPIQIKAETRVSLVVTPPVDDNMMQYLRGVVIYDGPDWNSTCLGTALQVYYGKTQLVSSGKYLTVRQLSPYYSLGRTMLIFQDYENTKDIVQYQGASCAFVSDCGQIVMDGSKGIAAVSTVNTGSYAGAEYLVGLSGDGTLDVYIGGKSKSKANLITSYPVSNSGLLLPQEFLGYVRTYVLDGKSAKLNMTQTVQLSEQTGTVGRKGFFASRYYKSGSASPYQNVYDFVSTSSGFSRTLVTFSFNIKEADFVSNTTLSINVKNNNKDTYNQVFNSSNKPPVNTQIQALGDSFSVDYKTYNYPTTGFYLDYEIMKSSSRFGVLVVFLVLLMNLY